MMHPVVSISRKHGHAELSEVDEDELAALPLQRKSQLDVPSRQPMERKNKARKRIGPARAISQHLSPQSSSAASPILIESSEEEKFGTKQPTRKRKRSSLPPAPTLAPNDARYGEIRGAVRYSPVGNHTTASSTPTAPTGSYHSLKGKPKQNGTRRGRTHNIPPPPEVDPETTSKSSSEVDDDDYESTYDSDFSPPDHEVVIPHPDIPGKLTPYHPRGAIPWMKVLETRWRDIADVRGSPEDSYLYRRSKTLKADLGKVS
jgi:hypothetical protein